MTEPIEFYRALADETRLRCLMLMVAEGELCVCELTQALDLIQPKVSRHLAALRAAAVVSDRKQGQWVFYSIADDLPDWCHGVLAETATAALSVEPFVRDRCRLVRMKDQPGQCLTATERDMEHRVFNVLFLCTGNSARSLMAEALIRHWGDGRFRGFSAGSRPAGQVNPRTLSLLEEQGVSAEGLRSKDWSEFWAPGAPVLDFVFTVCDDAAGEECPAWPGQPMTAHWGVADPVKAEGGDMEKAMAFREGFRQLENRIKIFTSLRIEGLSRLSLQQRLEEIGRTSISEAP